jgi:hypothetical protein
MDYGHYIYASMIEDGFDPLHASMVCDALNATYFNSLEYDRTDNLRIARTWVDGEVEDFEKRRERGCCGSFESGVPVEMGTIWIGFNYGH